MRIARKLALAITAGCLLLPVCAGADVLLGVFADQNGKAFNFASPNESENNLLAVEKSGWPQTCDRQPVHHLGRLLDIQPAAPDERCGNFILLGDGLSAFSKLANDPYFDAR
jgi:hypothetical protein